MMDLRTLRSEIDKLSEIVEGWNAPESIPEIERDMVLEKLRTLYEEVRFAGRMSGAKGDDRADTSAARPMAETPVSAPAPDFIRNSASEYASEPENTPEPEYTSEPEPASEPEFAPAFVAEEQPDPTPESAPEPAPESAPEPESTPWSEPAPEPMLSDPQIVIQSDAEPESEQVLAAYRTPGQEPDSDQVPIGYRTSRTTKKSDPAVEIYVPVSAPTLFGLDSDESEAEKLRHRHKQRVILSLYGADSERPAAESARQEQESVAYPFETVRATSDSEAEAEPYFESTPDRGSEIPSPENYAASSEKTVEEDEFVFEEISLNQNTVLGDVIKSDVQTLADTLASRRDGCSEARRSEPITDLRQAIGLNDKFLLIRDLFGGDGAACDEALEILNGFGDLDDCMIHIAENYAWNPNSDGAKFLMEIIERKFA